jgi:hypothetical protein
VTFFLQLPAACEVVESGAPAPPSHSPSQARRRRNHLFQMASYTTSVDSTSRSVVPRGSESCRQSGRQLRGPSQIRRRKRLHIRLTCATADPNCCHLACTSQAPWASKLPAPSQARAVGPAELTVRRRCPVGSRTTGVARLNEDRVALARFGRDRGRYDQAKFDLAVVAGSVRTQQATRLTCATADPNCCHLGCTAQAP